MAVVEETWTLIVNWLLTYESQVNECVGGGGGGGGLLHCVDIIRGFSRKKKYSIFALLGNFSVILVHSGGMEQHLAAKLWDAQCIVGWHSMHTLL